jgi:hypothetical protein
MCSRAEEELDGNSGRNCSQVKRSTNRGVVQTRWMNWASSRVSRRKA